MARFVKLDVGEIQDLIKPKETENTVKSTKVPYNCFKAFIDETKTPYDETLLTKDYLNELLVKFYGLIYRLLLHYFLFICA